MIDFAIRFCVVRAILDFVNFVSAHCKWLKHFGRVGVPLYVILRPGGSIVAEVFPEVITRQTVIDALNK